MSPINLTKETFQDVVMESDLPTVIDFWAGWCMPCQMMGPVFADLGKEYEGKLQFAKVDTEKERELSILFKIRSLPTLAFVYKGKVVDEIFGFLPKEHLKEKIDKILDKILVKN